MKAILITFALSFVFLTSSCARKIREVKYNAYQMIGMEKRDIFKREVKNVKEEQEDTSEAFKDALTKLKEMYKVDGGEIEKQHSRLQSSYEKASDEAAELKERIRKVNEVAGDLFSEWREEINDISSDDLKKKSRKKLKETQARFKELQTQMSSAEKKMDPVLTKLKDQVIFLKHNLNAKAIAGLKAESSDIEDDIQTLIKEVEEASREADKFIKDL